MLRRALRAALFLGLSTLLSTVARSALASTAERWAPYCDDRGATALAPPPALEAPDEAILRARASACASDELTLHATVTRAHRGSQSHSADGPQVVTVRVAPLVPPPGELTNEAPVAARATPGVRGRLERPPRS